jgi:hypothetical protein
MKWKHAFTLLAALLPAPLAVSRAADHPPSAPAKPTLFLEQSCIQCHSKDNAKGGLDLASLAFDLKDQVIRDKWVQIHDRVEKGEMPPRSEEMPLDQRAGLLKSLATSIYDIDHAEVLMHGRGPMRRLNRDEYEQNLRDVLRLPALDIRDLMPEDREGHRFNKTTRVLDISRVQLAAYLDAAEAALREATASGSTPLPGMKFRAAGTSLFPEITTFGEREAMFFAKEGQAVEGKRLEALRDDPALELALFRSASWPYYGYPRGFIAKLPGEYRVRFSARAVVQGKGYTINAAPMPVPMTFRARKPSGPDVSGDVRATGGILDIHPVVSVRETTLRLRAGETFEYSLLGLPVPLARNVKGGPPTYRYPPFPEGGQPGVAFQWLEVEGPIPPESWPPPSHRVLFDEMGVSPVSARPEADARRLLIRFAGLAARQPVPDESLEKYVRLVLARLEQKASFAEAMLAGYKAFLCSGHFLYLPEPRGADAHFAIASRLSHLLANTRPDSRLAELAHAGRLRDSATLRAETRRLISDAGFDRFVRSFTDYWLDLRHIRRDDPDVRLYPEYRFDDYLVESMEGETRAFFAAMVRDNLQASVLVKADFIFANDRLSRHYRLPALDGSTPRKVAVPAGSPYGGLLTQAAILKVTANGTSTSPVVRGAWVMERLLGQPPPPPPPSVPAVEPDIRGAKTIRQILALHTQSKSCSACHAKFDPVGFGLENFDILGGWRTRYRALEEGERVTGIDRAGHDFAYMLAAPVDAGGRLPEDRVFRDIHDLKTLLTANPRPLARNLLHQFTVYSTGTPIRFSDRPEIEAMLDACAAEGYRVGDLVHALVQSRIFLGEKGP